MTAGFILFNQAGNLFIQKLDIFTQPTEAVESDIYNESGLGARVPVYVHPIDPVAIMRDVNSRQIDKEKMKPYYSALEALCINRRDNPVIVSLSEDAQDEWEAFHRRVADKLERGGDWYGQYALLNKIGTLSVQYAVIFYALENPDFMEQNKIIIDAKTYQMGIRYIEFLTSQSLKARASIEHSLMLKQAMTVKKWVLKKKDTEVIQAGFKCDRNFINSQSSPLRKNIPEILNILVEHKWLFKNR